MSKVQLSVVLGVVILLIGLGTYFEGQRTSRWGDPHSEALESFKLGIQNFPVSVGSWDGDLETETREMVDLVAREAGAEACLTRNYHSDIHERDVMVNIICGFSRKVAIHTPDACYRGAGFEIEGEIQTIKIPYVDSRLKAQYASEGEIQSTFKAQKEAEFRTALFVRTEQDGSISRQRVFWSWKGEGTDWIAPEIPRNRWRPADPLCKMYLSTVETADNPPIQSNPVYEFGKMLFPELEYMLDGKYVQGMEIPKSTAIEESTKKAPSPEPSKPVETREQEGLRPKLGLPKEMIEELNLPGL